MAQHWFVKTKSGIKGPFSAAKLKTFAKENKIQLDTKISLDKESWVSASKVKNLFPPPEPVIELDEGNVLKDSDEFSDLNEVGDFDEIGILADVPFVPPAPTSGLISQREKAYRKVFGPFHSVDHPLQPGQPHIDVYIHPAHAARPMTTLVTGGMSDHRMKIPGKGMASSRCELMMYVDKPNKLQIGLLRFLASQPFLQKTWFSYGSTMNNGNPPEPIFEGSLLDHYLFMPPAIDADFDIQDSVSIEGQPLQLLWVVPITGAERKVIMKKGMDEFGRLMEKHDHPMTLQPDRKCYASRGWFRK